MSFQQGLSGLNATSKSLEVIGNNIANANTFGAKSSRAEFADVYAASVGGGTPMAGIGTTLANVAQQFSQGNITSTPNPMDLAINGRGFFMLQDPRAGNVYSRNGQFRLDREGYVSNGTGQKLLAQRWDDAVGRAVGDPASIRVVAGGGGVVKTGAGLNEADRGIRLSMNFDAATPVVAGRAAFNVQDTASYDYSTSQTVYDGQGMPLTMAYYMRKEAHNDWSVFASVDGQQFDPTTGEIFHDSALPLPAAVAVSRIMFGENGRITSIADALGVPVATGAPLLLTVNDSRQLFDAGGVLLPGASQMQVFSGLRFDIGASTQFGASFAIADLRQDGYPPGELTGVSFDTEGVFKASYSNGRFVNLAQLALADFQNVQGLSAMGGNAWSETFSSGTPVVNAPGASSMGLLQAGALEESNIDLTAELVSMITAQRIYQANAQTIKTMDQVLQTMVNLR